MRIRPTSYLLTLAITFFLASCNGENQSSKFTSTPDRRTTNHTLPPQPTSSLPVDHVNKFLTFHGATGYGATREYTVEYDPSIWELIANPESNPHPIYAKRLQNRQDSTCSIGLFNGPMQRLFLESIELAGRKWELAPQSFTVEQPTQTIVSLVVYATDAVDPAAGPIQYYLTVYVPTPYEPPNKSGYQQQAEQVIATFRIVDSIREP